MTNGMHQSPWERDAYPTTLEAQKPQRFVAQHLAPVFFGRTQPTHSNAIDRDVTTEEQFWTDSQDSLFDVVQLTDYILSDWFPRTPGVFWTRRAKDARELTFADEGEYDPELGNYYKPMAKLALIEDGGLGTIRLRPRKIDDVYCWLATSLKGKFCHAGIPLAIPETLLNRSGIRWGERVNLIGRLRFLQDAGLDDVAAGVRGTRPLILFVEELDYANPSRRKHQVVLTPVVMFETQNDNRNWRGDFNAPGYTFVHCDSGDDHRLEEAVDWMERYAAKFSGRVLTNFDEQVPRLANAPLSYQRLITRSYERTVITQYIGNMMVDRIDNLYHEEVHVGHNISVGGNAIINIDSTLNQVTQTIGSSQSLDAPQKAELDRMVQSLRTDLDAIKGAHPDEARAIADALQTATANATKLPDQRKKNMLQLSADGLIAAAKTVGDIAPSILTTARLIAKFVVGLVLG